MSATAAVPSRTRLVVVLALLAVAVTACGVGEPDHVRIGVVGPLTGDRAFLGQELVNGATLAVDELNRDGGLLGEDVELIVVDDADLVALPGQLADLAERQRVSAIIGPEAPGVLLGDRSPLTRRDVPAILPSAFGGDLADAGSLVVRTIPSAKAQAERLGGWLRDTRGGREVAILVVDPVEGEAVRQDLVAGFAAADVDVGAVVDADPQSAQLGPAVSALRRDAPNADMVLIWGPPVPSARATLAARAQDWDTQLAVSAAAFVAEYRSLAGTASEGVVLAFPFRREWFSSDALTTWLLRYYRDFGLGALPDLNTLVLDVPSVAVASSDAVRLIAAAVRAADSRVPGDVADALAGIEADGLLQTYVLDDREAWSAADLHVARFHGLAVTFDADPTLDTDYQRRVWEGQISADYLPASVLEGPAGAVIRQLIENRSGELPVYTPPLPAPLPVGIPGVTGTGEPVDVDAVTLRRGGA